MIITLPDEIREELERKAKNAGFHSIEKYVTELIQTDEGPNTIPEPSPGAKFTVNNREELEAKLLEGINTRGDVLVDHSFWEQRRKAAADQANSGVPQ